MKRLLLSLFLLTGFALGQDDLVSPHLKAPPFNARIITAVGSTLDPGSYTLTPGQYNFAVTGATPTPSPTPSPTPNPTPSPTPAPTPSPDGTAIPPATQIIDSALNIWTLSGGVVLSNGDPAGHSANVILVLWKGGKVWQENNEHGWWYWNGSAWISGAAPIPTPTPSPTPTPPPGGAGKPGIKLFGGILGWGFPNAVIPPDPLWKKIGAATGNQFPSNWWRDDYTMGDIGYANYGSGLADKWRTARDWCDANNANGPCVQLYYPGKSGNWAKSRYIQFLQTIAPYCKAGTYQIAVNEISGNKSIPGGDQLFNELGGAGATGWDGLINLIKLQRQYLPGALLCLNEYNVADWSSGTTFFNADQCIKLYKILHDNGAPLDWLGFEGYWMNSQGGSLQGYMAQSDKVAAAIQPYLTGACGTTFVGWTEFTPDPCGYCGHCNQLYPTQKDAWNAMLTAFANNKYILGVTGPWEGFRRSQAFSSGSWFFNDRTGVDPGNWPDCVHADIQPSLTWLQGWVATNVHN